jgi:CheY-like chemotaxis protein
MLLKPSVSRLKRERQLTEIIFNALLDSSIKIRGWAWDSFRRMNPRIGKKLFLQNNFYVLVVESDDLAMALTTFFTMCVGGKYTLSHASSVSEAQEILSKHHVDLLIMGQGTCDPDVINFWGKAKSMYPEIKGIIMTADPKDDIKDSALAAGVSVYLEKPFELDDFLQAILKVF